MSLSIGRTAIHIAVLKEREDIVQYLSTRYQQTMHVGDNVNATISRAFNYNCVIRIHHFGHIFFQLERTALHYAMGVSSVEVLSRILIQNGSKRVLKDLKGRQPSYYFMNKSDITRLAEEEDEDEL